MASVTLKELKRRHETGEMLNHRSIRKQIKEQLKRECAVRGCHESLAFTRVTKALCDAHSRVPLAKAPTTNSKQRVVKRKTKAEVKRMNKLKKQRYYERHGITFDKTTRKRAYVVPEAADPTRVQPYNGEVLVYENYKEPLKPIETTKGHGFYGTLGLTDDGEFAQCHVCGNLFANLGGHIRVHKLTAERYKEKYELAQGTSLMGEKERERRRALAVKPWDGKLPSHLAEYNRKVQAGEIKHPGSKHKSWSLEKRNKEGMCPDQVLVKIQELAEQLGRAPSEDEFVRHYEHRFIGSIVYQHGSYLNAVNKIGLKSAKELKEHTREGLLEALVDFHEKYGRIPMTSDFRRGMLPSRGAYFRYFGTLNNARIEAGLNAVLPMPFGQIKEVPPEEYQRYRDGHRLTPEAQRKYDARQTKKRRILDLFRSEEIT